MNDKIKVAGKDILLLQNDGSFFIYSYKYSSRFFGYFIPYKDYFIKIFDTISNLDIKEKIKDIELFSSNYGIIRYENDDLEKYYLCNNCLYYETNKLSNIRIYFDIKHIYDIDEWNRIYNYYEDNGKIILKFKKNDIDINLIIKGYESYNFINQWIKKEYNYDKLRNSPPFERYLYVPFEFKAKKLVISIDDIDINNINLPKNYDIEIPLYDLLKERLLSFRHKYLSVGFPWYYQEWTRDVLISLKGFYIMNEREFVKEKLIEYSSLFLSNGKIKNIKNDINGNSDSIGWYGKRLFEFRDLFDENLFNKLVNILKENIEKYEYNFFDDKKNLFFAYPNETWMDTLNRKYPIELQFLFLENYYNLYNYFKDEQYKEKYERLKESIRKNYLEDNSLIDDIENRAIRPNIFLSYYIHDKIFNDYEWERFFDYGLNHLFLEWGGLSSISKYDKRFVRITNGDNFFNNNGKSMHNGDSWIYINNIAALSMHRLNKEKYKRYINKILEADYIILKNIGTLNELSSAEHLSLSGALSQLWSISTFIELAKELNFINNL